MDSCAWMNGQYGQYGPPSQSSQAATQLNYDSMWNRQTGSANNSYQYTILNTGLRPPQSAHFTFYDGAYSNKQMSNCQTSAVPHQAVSSQHPAGGATNASYVKALHGDLQNSFTNTQGGKPLNSGFISSLNQSPPSMMKASNSHPQQDMSAHWNQQGPVHWKQSVRTQNGTSFFMHLKRLLQNRNESTKPVSAYATTATTLPHEKGACSNTLVSTSAHNRQAANNQNHRPIGTQQGFYPSTPPPSYSATVSHLSSMTQKTRPYPVHLNSTHNREEATRNFSSETNELPLNPAADTEEQMVSRQIIARIAEDLQNSFTSRPDGHPPGYTSSTYRGSSNAPQSFPLSSGLSPSRHSLPKAAHGVMSRTQNSVDMSPQQRSAPHAFSVSATGDGSGNVFFPESNGVSKGNTVGSLSDASQLLKLPESISPQINKTVSSVANNSEKLEIFEKVSTIKANDSTIHTSPGRTGTRAVAVVQPLSQECYQVASKHTSSNTITQSVESTAPDESLGHPEKLFISPAVEKNKKDLYLREESNPYPENPNQMMSNKCVISNSAVANSGTCVPSDSAGLQGLSQKQFCADDTGSELAVNMQVDHGVSLTAQQPVTSEAPASQSGDEDKSENPAELSAVPTIPWTAATLNGTLIKSLQDAEKAEMKLRRNITVCDSSRQILSLFWNDESRNLLCKLRAGWYKDLINDVGEFLKEHVTSDTVILSQVKYAKQLKNYYVLKDDKVYSEVPYRSSWLNVNEKLDDIDEEFGFPWSLKHRLHILENHSQPDQVERVNSIPAQSVSEALNNSLSQTELGHVESGKEKQASTVEAISTQAASPNEPESADPSDPYYLFEIEVFPPEEAKRIFEQAQSKMPERTDTDSLPGEVMISSVEGELPEATDVTLNDSELESESVCPITQICCIERWKEIICGSKTPSLSKCQCTNEQSLQDCTDKTLDKDEMAVDKELCKKLKRPRENDHKSHSDNKTENISKMRRNSSPPCITLISEVKDLSNSGTEIQLDTEKACIQGHFKSTESMQSCTSVSSDKETENLPTSEREVASQMSDLEETCLQSQLTSADVAKSSLETEEEQTQISATTALHTTFSHRSKQGCVERKRKRECSNNRFFPLFKKANKCRSPVNVDSQPSTCRRLSTDATDSEPLATNPRAVQLVLFGSAPQDKCVLIGNRKSHMSSPGVVSDGVSRPPAFLSVKLSPLKRKSGETVQTAEYSVKQLIHEKWRRSFPPTEIKGRSKLKTQRHTVTSLSGASFKKAEIVGPTNNKKLAISNKIRKRNKNTTHKRRRALSVRHRHGEVRKDAVTLQQPADEEINTAEKESHTVTPLQENSVLRFSVLPNTFTLMDQDGSSKRMEMEGPVPDKPTLEEKDKTSNKTITREKGTWYPNPEKVCPLRSPPMLKNSSIFHQFQKKYMEKTQPSMDE